MLMRALVAVLLSASAASVAQAATILHAGPLRVGVGGQLVCEILNVGSQDVTSVGIEATADETVPSGTPVLTPGAVLTASRINESAGSQPGRCKFTFKGAKKSVRASACVRADGQGTTSCGAALPAD